MTYPDTRLFIDGAWCDGERAPLPVLNPATGAQIGTHAHAAPADLDRALAAAARAFAGWRDTPAMTRAVLLRAAGDLLRQRADAIAPLLTMEQGKPLDQARAEVLNSADILDWCAEEARRLYGRSIPARSPGIRQTVEPEAIGPVAAFTPWNFPMSQAVRKVAAALAAGCSMVLKPAEDTPASAAALVQALADAGLPAGVLNLVLGTPSEISGHLIASPVIRKVSFTGSTPVGRLLGALAGQHLKPVTLELGGHAPVIVFDDADIDRAATLLAQAKYRNAGQVCISPTRFLVQGRAYAPFVAAFVAEAEKVRVGNGLEPGVTMGPLIAERRVQAIEALVADALDHGAELLTGGRRIGNVGAFHAPTVLAGVPVTARAMSEEPFGPLALIAPFDDPADAIAEANRLPYGLAAYAYTGSAARAAMVARAIDSGMVSINHHGLGLIETPFGGIKDSGHGREGGFEAVHAYTVTKFVTHAEV